MEEVDRQPLLLGIAATAPEGNDDMHDRDRVEVSLQPHTSTKGTVNSKRGREGQKVAATL